MTTTIKTVAAGTFDSRNIDLLFSSEPIPFPAVARVLLILLAVFVVLSLGFAAYIQFKNKKEAKAAEEVEMQKTEEGQNTDRSYREAHHEKTPSSDRKLVDGDMEA
mmetsp:Transcript_33706/g.24365  ORF Transcript_33706/g.24365 Transcript_33706/m.24365 type:complete len:106 (-) Transcript_33706:136-453(-)|eukprot:CAMPEP_0116878084 /NCGR_PEP_ID=MMETSP0463-20121206/9827_1 /TAXON_ID=181622 /ORGANISM="Strombidinopsis sp, Strain SopsisLIS2011" /LENGTH=105 /DNA_ID=CAMNT_0004525937 /DNA_START=23 /DNA_END=340 /DNA_ORIENTATION=+